MGKTKPGLPEEALQHLMSFYAENAETYEELSRREDYNNEIPKALSNAVDLKGSIVLELGAGTGRFALEVSKKAKLVYALDMVKPMLSILRKKMRKKGIRNVKILRSSYSRIPLPPESVDVIFSVWSFPAHSMNWDRDLREAKRVLRPGGRMILIDNYHGGEYIRIKKKLPGSFFLDFNYNLHKWMRLHGFKHETVNTWMNFGSKSNVEKLCGPFFGYDMATYLLAREKTSFEMRVSVFGWEKQ
jgi:ubiquinone/menaquinone biosynthesis C-methylase UbiE